MTASVPQVIPFEDVKQSVAKTMELAAEASRATGDARFVAMGLKVVKALYQEMKIEVNVGRYDPDYLEEVRKAIERVEAGLARRALP